MNKKASLIPGFFILMIFGLISVIVITISYFEFAMGNDYILIPIHNISNQSSFSPEILNGMDKVLEDYQNTNLDIIDNVWFLSFLIVSIMGIYIAYQQRQQSYFSWVTMLFIGMTIMMFIVGLFSILINWFYTDIMLKLFIKLVIHVPKFAYYVENFGFIWFIQACLMMLANIIDVDYATMFTRKKKEQDVIEVMEGEEIV